MRSQNSIIKKNNIMPNTAALQKALVVEDEGEMGLLLNIFMDEREFELDYVKDILSAQEYLVHKQPSVIILDNKLPDGFGVDFISYIKKNYPAIKIIMISGYGMVRDIAMDNGADLFLEKPFTKMEFDRALASLMHPEANGDNN